MQIFETQFSAVQSFYKKFGLTVYRCYKNSSSYRKKRVSKSITVVFNFTYDYVFFFSRLRVTFVRASGERIEAKAKVGDSLLDVVINNEIDLDGFGKYNK